MRKIQEFCPVCGIETTHRNKKVSKKKAGTSYGSGKKKKKSGHGTYPLPLKCMTCGYVHGGRIIKKKQRHHYY